MKTLFLTFCFLSTLTLPAFATAPEGGGSDGGANAIDYQLVEDYSQDLSEFCGYESFRSKLEQLRRELPDLAARIETRAKEMDWYEIPEKIATLPESRTGLRFKTQQPAYQPGGGHEIFISRVIFDEMCKRSPRRAGKTLMHEAIMALLLDRDAAKTRALVNKIYISKMDPVMIQETAYLHGFGSFLSRTQIRLLRAEATLAYIQAQRSRFQQAVQQCKTPGRNSGATLLKAQLALIDLHNQAAKPENAMAWKFALTKGAEGLEYITGLLTESSYGKDIKSPFGPWSLAYALGKAFDSPVSTLKSALLRYCYKDAFGDAASPALGIGEAVCALRTTPAEEPTSAHAQLDNEEFDAEEILRAQTELASNPDFATVLGMNLASFYDLEKDFSHVPLIHTRRESLESRAQRREIVAAAWERHSELKWESPRARLNQFCQSVEGLQSQATNMIEQQQQLIRVLQAGS